MNKDVAPETPAPAGFLTATEVKRMTVKELQKWLKEHGISFTSKMHRNDLVSLATTGTFSFITKVKHLSNLNLGEVPDTEEREEGIFSSFFPLCLVCL